MYIEQQKLQVNNPSTRPVRNGVYQNRFKHKHHSCYIAGNLAWYFNNVEKRSCTYSMQMEIEDRLVVKFGIPKAPLSNEAGARRISEVMWCTYITFPHFSDQFFKYLNEWFVISVPMHSTENFINEWRAWKILTGWGGNIRGGHVLDMFKHQWEYYALNSQFDEINPVRKMQSLRPNAPFYLMENEVVQNHCAVILP